MDASNEYGSTNTKPDDAPQREKPTIMLMGLRRSGKSSICRVVFHSMQPLDTLYIESTPKVTTEQFSSFIDFAVQELPGQLDYFEPTYDTERMFSNVGALIYVIDSQDEYLNALTNLHMIIEYAVRVNPKMKFDVFIHKVDGLSEDFRLDTQRDIMQRVNDELLDAGLDDVQVAFHLTSIFDHSIYEAFSRVIQRLIPQLPTLENLLNILCQHSGIEKAFLFDMNSKIYVATDSSPVDIQTYEVCSDFIDVAIDMDNLYEPRIRTTPASSSTCSSSIIEERPSSTSNQETTRIRTRPLLSCKSRLTNGIVLHLKEMIRGLALVYVMRRDETMKTTLAEYNVDVFRHGLQSIWEIR